MPHMKYSIIGLDPDKTAIASGRDLNISPKWAREICNTIKGMMFDKAVDYLEEVIAMNAMVPYKRHHKKRGHHAGLKKWHTGGYPVRASKAILKVLKNVEANADNKGLDIDRLKIIHAAAHRARVIKKNIPRAFGRSSPYYNYLTHVEIAVEEI